MGLLNGKPETWPRIGTNAPTEFDQEIAGVLAELRDALDSQNVYLKTLMDSEVETLDAIIYEHTTQRLNHTLAKQTFTIPAQTKQVEKITGVYWGFAYTGTGTAPTMPTVRSYLTLGENVIPFTNGTNSGQLTQTGFIVGSSSTRKATVQVKPATKLPATVTFTVVLFGIAVPSTLGVLH